MLRSAKAVVGYKVLARDGKIGSVNDFVVDVDEWVIRYLVVDVGGWLSDRKVIIPPSALDQPDWETDFFPVDLTKKQVEESPHIALEEPVSPPKEIEVHRYFKWYPYWAESAGGISPPSRPLTSPKRPPNEPYPEPAESEMRSMEEILDYDIQAKDGGIGRLQDVIMDDEVWAIRYMIIDTHKWLPGKSVLVSPAWASEVVSTEEKVYVDLTRKQVESSPEFDPEVPINREYETRLYDYYGRPKYWE